jgi:two-component system phosphate regulon response regulator PhoB
VADRRTILICDDQPALRELVRGVLEIGPYDMHEARDGQEAVELAEQLEPDLILLDLMMPVLDGLQVLERVRAMPGLAQTPVVVLTASTRTADRDAIERADGAHLLVKPFSPMHLLELVEQLLTA